MTQAPKYTIVFVRHGESEWNQKNLFTGWVDVPLSAKGIGEAKESGALLKTLGIDFDIAYTSVLKRAIKTLDIILEEIDQVYIPVIKNWRLNERHYGGLQGLDKVATVEKYGAEQVQIWRRSYDIPPPPLTPENEIVKCIDRRYKDLSNDLIPKCESLELTGKRTLPLWDDEIIPLVKKGKKILIVAHGNSIRSIVKKLDNISNDDITQLNIPTGIPLIYHFDEHLNVIPSPSAIKPLRGLYLGDIEDVKRRIDSVANQTKKK